MSRERCEFLCEAFRYLLDEVLILLKVVRPLNERNNRGASLNPSEIVPLFLRARLP